MNKTQHHSTPQTKAHRAHGHDYQLHFIVWGILAWLIFFMAMKYSGL